MTGDWGELTRLTQGRAIVVERVRLAGTSIAIEGEFEPPALAALPMEDQLFVAAFVRSHGSIKEMERLFGVSYPTVKSRLERISAALAFLEIAPVPDRGEILDRLAKGEVSVDEAEEELRRS